MPKTDFFYLKWEIVCYHETCIADNYITVIIRHVKITGNYCFKGFFGLPLRVENFVDAAIFRIILYSILKSSICSVQRSKAKHNAAYFYDSKTFFKQPLVSWSGSVPTVPVENTKAIDIY